MSTTETTNGRTIDERWPTARAVALKLGCSRQQVYKLEKRGKLRGEDVREHGVKLRRYDPDTVRELSDAGELEHILAGEVTELDDDDDDAGDTPRRWDERLAGKVVDNATKAAAEARKATQEAFELVTKPAVQYTASLLGALESAWKRIAELEEKLNRVYDDHREARLEEREAALMQAQMERSDARKDLFFRTLLDSAPAVLEQVKASLGGGSGPLIEFMKNAKTEDQIKMIAAIQMVIAEEPPAAGPSSPEKGTTDDTRAA